ncbi:MAG: GNAT family N-acetyltransferase [Oscillospiraceae bacterium]|nr:GNAT family N-acetyltransferase [Oscillospiraceae bacterium]
MEYIAAQFEMADAICHVLHTAIQTIYPKYYPKEVVEFFCRHHSREHILDGIASGHMGVLVLDGTIAGTGCFDGNHITGVYVLPRYQKQGCGSYILDCLETKISRYADTAVLDASLSAVFLYERRGYKTTGHGILELENDVRLVYEIMEKRLSI